METTTTLLVRAVIDGVPRFVLDGVTLGGDMERMGSLAYYGAFFGLGAVVLLLVAILVVLISRR